MSLNRQKIDGFHFGKLRVKPGEAMHVDGFVWGDVVVEAGAVLKVDGFIFGSLLNQGGQVHVNGFVFGRRSEAAAESGDVIDPVRRLSRSEQEKSPAAKLVRLISRK